MRLAGRSTTTKISLHSKDTTFCAVDVHPSEFFTALTPANKIISYTGIIIPQPEYFLGFAQWKDTEGPGHRLKLLRKIQKLVEEKGSCPVLCFSLHSTRFNGWRLGQLIIEDALTRKANIASFERKKGKRYRFDGKEFSEAHTISMALYASVIVILHQHIAREITKLTSLDSLKKTTLQFLLDTVSGDPSNASFPRWNLDLVLFIIENTPLIEVLLDGLSKSCFDRYGIETPRSNEINDEKITGTNKIPLMIAADWFAKICSRYQDLANSNGDLDEDDAIMIGIVETLKKGKNIIIQELPDVDSLAEKSTGVHK